MKNKIISLFVIINLLGMNLQAAGFFNSFLSSSVPPVMGNANGSNVFYTGSYSFKTGNRSGNVPLLFNIQAPSINVGCGGISIKGMFGSLIDTDALENLLKDSGAALAWGIMMGLVYSLPGVADVLAKIQQFARELQKLLGNACNIGKKMGRIMAEGGSMFGHKFTGISAISGGDTKQWLDNAKQGVDNFMDKHMGWSKGLDDQLTLDSETSVTKEEQAGIIGASIKPLLYINDYAEALKTDIYKILEKNGMVGPNKMIAYKDLSDSEVFTNGNSFNLTLDDDFERLGGSSLDEEDRNALAKKLFLMTFYVNYVGSSYLLFNQIKNITNKIYGPDANTNNMTDQEKSENADFIENLTKGRMDTLGFEKGNFNESGIIDLLLGYDKISDKMKNDQIIIPKMIPITVKTGKLDSDTTKTVLLDLSSVSENSEAENFYQNFNLGLVNICIMKNSVQGIDFLENLLLDEISTNVNFNYLHSIQDIDNECNNTISDNIFSSSNISTFNNVLLQSNNLDSKNLFHKLFIYNLKSLNMAFLNLLKNISGNSLKLDNTYNSKIIQVGDFKQKLPNHKNNDEDIILEGQKSLKDFIKSYTSAINGDERFNSIPDDFISNMRTLDKLNNLEGMKSHAK